LRASRPGESAGADSLHGEVWSRPRRLRRRLAVALGALAVGGATLAVVLESTRRRPPPEVAVQADVTETPLARAARLLASGDLDGAEQLLAQLRQSGDSVEVQEALAAAAEKRGNRLGALAHQHRATRLRPRDAGPRARLAALLFRLGQPGEACHQARVALALDPHASVGTVLADAHCPE
jgi:predicted Zn-dependent protease